MEEDDYVGFTTAVELRKLGFDKKCDCHYTKNGKFVPGACCNDYPDKLAAPTLWQVQKWLREEKAVEVTVDALETDNKIYCYFNKIYCDFWWPWMSGDYSAETYEQALAKGIEGAIFMLNNTDRYTI